MGGQEPAFDPATIERETRALWKGRQLPPAGGGLGPREGPLVLQFEGAFTPGEPEMLVIPRAIAADIDARYLALAGRRAIGTLRFEPTDGAAVPASLATSLERLGIWIGGDGSIPWDTAARRARVETMVGRLAHSGLLVARDVPLRVCPHCAEARSPERIVYQEQDGEVYLIRFELAGDERVIQALVWVDSPWQLLATSALVLHPEAPYVIARCRRGPTEELVLAARSSLDRLREWAPHATFEVIEEHPGRFFEGKPYAYPLRHEFPTGGSLDPPGGTVLTATEVTREGTGILPLVPGHGNADATLADRRGVTGWPLVTPRGQLDLTLMHKYAGLDVGTASEFILRDLAEGGSIFAHARIRHGVPHCAVCGTELLWVPGRAWCLAPTQLPPDRRADLARLLPGAPAVDRLAAAPWPVSAATPHDDPQAVALLECSRCERLDALDGPASCPCGAQRYPVRRRLVPSASGVLSAWARPDPFPATASVRLYVGARRRVPAILHHLAASAALDGGPGEISARVLPSLPDASVGELLDRFGADAVRMAFAAAADPTRGGGAIEDRCRVARRGLERVATVVGALVASADAPTLAGFFAPNAGPIPELETEDHAFLARWEKVRLLALADFDRSDPAAVLRRVDRFLVNDLAEYRRWVAPGWGVPGAPPPKRATLRALAHVVREIATTLAPIAPFTAESIVHRLTSGRASLFEGSIGGVDRSLQKDELVAAWDRWRPILRAVEEFRRRSRVPPGTPVPSIVLSVADDAVGDRLRTDRAVLERLARVARVVVASPREPWAGRQGKYVPVESEIQRLYPSQATQIAHLLARTPPRSAKTSTGATELSVVIQGHPLKILPSMIEYVESLPPGFFPHPWSLGELYLELPPGGTPPERFPPPLSPDAFWLVRRLQRRLLGAEPSPTPRIGVVATGDPLASELRRQSEAIARYLGLGEIRVIESAEERPAGRWSGRTRTGAAWWIEVPGIVPAHRPAKHRPPRPHCTRIPTPPPLTPRPEVDYGSDEMLQHWDAIRALGSELDEALGAPVIGPTKVARAWEKGLTSVDAYRQASFEQLLALPGFDAATAALILEKLGGTPPPRAARRREAPHRVARSAAPPVASASVSTPPSTPEPLSPPPTPDESIGAAAVAAGAAATAEDVPEPGGSLDAGSAPEPTPVEPPAGAATAATTGADLAPEAAGAAAVAETTDQADGTIGEPAPDEAPSGSPSEGLPSPDSGASDHDGGREAAAAAAAAGAAGIAVESAEAARSEEPTVSPEAEPAPTAPEAPPETTSPSDSPAGSPDEPSHPGEAVAGVAAAGAVAGVAAEAISEPGPASEVAPNAEDLPPPQPSSPAPESSVAAGGTSVDSGAGREGLGVGAVVGASAGAAAVATAESRTDQDVPPEPGPGPDDAPTTTDAVPSPAESEPSVAEGTEVAAGAAELDSSGTAPADEPAADTGAPAAGTEVLGEPTPSETVPPEPAVPESGATPSGSSAGSAGGHEGAALGAGVAAAVGVGAAVAMSDRDSAQRDEVATPADDLADAETATPAAVAAVPPPKPAGVELVVGASPYTSIQPFLEATAAGHRGLCLVRDSPERVTAQVRPRPVDVYWLTNLGRGKTVRPSDLPGIFGLLGRAVNDEHVTAVFVEGVEYLVRIHGVEEIIGRLHELDRHARSHDARIWVHLTPDLLRPSDLSRFTEQFGEHRP